MKSENLLTCSRSDSRVANSVWNDMLLTELSDGVVVKSTCPFHSANNIFFDQELHKFRISSNLWQCLFCKKKFVTENYVDKHMELRHTEFLLVRM